MFKNMLKHLAKEIKKQKNKGNEKRVKIKQKSIKWTKIRKN